MKFGRSAGVPFNKLPRAYQMRLQDRICIIMLLLSPRRGQKTTTGAWLHMATYELAMSCKQLASYVCDSECREEFESVLALDYV